MNDQLFDCCNEKYGTATETHIFLLGLPQRHRIKWTKGIARTPGVTEMREKGENDEKTRRWGVERRPWLLLVVAIAALLEK